MVTWSVTKLLTINNVVTQKISTMRPLNTLFSWYIVGGDSGYGLSQWETPLHCNGVSHWQSPKPEWSLYCYMLALHLVWYRHCEILHGSIHLEYCCGAHDQSSGPRFKIKTVFLGIGIPFMKFRRSSDNGNLYTGKTASLLRRPPERVLNSTGIGQSREIARSSQ